MKRLTELISFDNLNVSYSEFSCDDLKKNISYLKMWNIINKYGGLNLEKREDCFMVMKNENIDELIFNTESEKEGDIIYEMSLILLMKIMSGSVRAEKNLFNNIMISAELINLNGLDRLKNIFEKSTNNYHKLFISIIISNCFMNIPIPRRFSFIYESLKNYLIFFFIQIKSSSSSLSSSSYLHPFLPSSPFFDVNTVDVKRNIYKHYYCGIKSEMKCGIEGECLEKGDFSLLMSWLYSSVSSEKLLVFILSGLLSISCSDDNHERLIKIDLNLLIPILYFLSFRNNCEVKERIISIFYNFLKNEKMVNRKKNEFIKIIRKHRILKYLFVMIEETKNNEVIEICLKTLLFIHENSFEEIKMFGEKHVIEILEKMIEPEMNNIWNLFSCGVKERLCMRLEEVFFLLLKYY
jgi:hypothetical protein